MKNYFVNALAISVSLLCLASAAHAGFSRVPEQQSAPAFDPHDLSGYWLLDGSGTIGPNPPAMTPEGMARAAENIPDNAVPLPHLANDPEKTCNPVGFPRLLVDSEPVEFVQFDDRILQLFQWEHRVRVLWLDGRELPAGENLENLGPAWYGHSVAEWEGDTLVVNTVGLDDRAWLVETTGHPKSFHARIEERYRRVDADTVEVQLTVYDPTYYTDTWVGDIKAFRRLQPEDYTFSGWTGLFSGVTEGICAPMNELEYNEGFRDSGIETR